MLPLLEVISLRNPWVSGRYLGDSSAAFSLPRLCDILYPRHRTPVPFPGTHVSEPLSYAKKEHERKI